MTQSGPSGASGLPSVRWVPGRDQLQLLGTLVDGGVRIDDALVMLEKAASDRATREGASVASRMIRSGTSLAETLGSLGAPRHVVASIASGERTGRLADALRGSATLVGEVGRMRASVRRALVYPGLILCSSPLTAAAAGTVSERSVGCLDVDLATLDAFVAIALPEQAVIEVVRDERPGCVGHPLGIPPGEDADRSWSCAAGDAFVWGRYAGRRTVLAEDDIQIVWDVEPGDAAAPAPLERGDLLGLVAGDSVVLRRPVGRPNRRVAPLGPNLPVFGPGLPPFGAYPLDAPSEVPVTWDRPRIVAALAALRGSVTLQNPFLGQQHPGPLEIVGSVAARFPGVLAWEERTSTGTLIGETGYPAVLRYDRRLLLDAPPLLPMTDGGGLRILHRDLG